MTRLRFHTTFYFSDSVNQVYRECTFRRNLLFNIKCGISNDMRFIIL